METDHAVCATRMPSPIGELTLVSDGECITGLYMENCSSRGSAARRDRRSMPRRGLVTPEYGGLCPHPALRATFSQGEKGFEERPAAAGSLIGGDAPLLREARAQLRAYFKEELKRFDLPLRLAGTAFQQRVWSELCNIPYGETISYAELAGRIGQPTASRAVGLANGRNPVSIVVPCHRVIGANGTLTGYAGGLPRKRWLLDHERGVPRTSLSLDLAVPPVQALTGNPWM